MKTLMKTETENAVTCALRLAAAGQTPAQIARVLYAEDGMNLSAEAVAKALYFGGGLDLSASEVAQVLSVDLNLTASTVASILLMGLDLRVGDAERALSVGLRITPMRAAMVLDDLFKYPDSEEQL